MQPLGFPLFIRITHLANLLFLTLLVRSGIEILAAFPKLHWDVGCQPGRQWLDFSSKAMPEDRLWTSEEEMEHWSSWIALPGRKNLGVGRHWHFWSVTGWLATGLAYVVGLFATGQWLRLVPTSWAIFPQAWAAFVTYLDLQLPPEPAVLPFNALQQLTYFGVIFVLAPLQILTGLAQSPAIAARFPWYAKLFHGHQGARSLHFLGMVAFVLFVGVHVATVVVHQFGYEATKIVLGNEQGSHSLADAIALGGLGAVFSFHVVATVWSYRHPDRVRRLLQLGVQSLRSLLLHRLESRQDVAHPPTFLRVNGQPPRNPEYAQLAATGFSGWRLRVHGLVAQPLDLSLDELHRLPYSSQRTVHVCIQGWTGVAQWGGVAVRELLERCRPLAGARYLVLRTLDEKWEQPGHGNYYTVIDLKMARKPQTLLAYEMNGQPLPIAHGAPLRLRLESQLGYRHAKYVHDIELVGSFSKAGQGHGSWRSDVLHYEDGEAGI